MEKLNIAHRKQLGRHLTSLGMACAICLTAPHMAPSAAAQESLVQKELSRRITNARKANELLQQGDSAYNTQDYKSAVTHYTTAFSLLPGGSMNQELRAAAAQRYATAATERSRQLAKTGKYDQAKLLLDQVLTPDVAPAHPGALKLRGQIDDPIRYNHALTTEHVKDVQNVGISLREAEGFYNLGQYDRALAVYQDVLRIDQFNKAARRGMEKIAATKSDYYRAAHDQTRSTLLGEVDQAWEMSVNPEPGNVVVPGLGAEDRVGASLREKLERIIIPSVNFKDTSLDEAIDFIRVKSRQGDAPSITGQANGVNIVLNLGDGQSDTALTVRSARADLQLRNVSLAKLLDYIADQTHTQWHSDGASVLISPLGSVHETIITKSFKVPPHFLSSATAKAEDDSGDIFNTDSNDQGGLLPSQISITEFLQSNGINFPEGASASYNANTNTLMVRNTTSNLGLIDQLVSLISDEEPVQVVIRTTIMRVSESKIKALGFDWMISPAYLGNNLFLGGGSEGNGTALADMPLSPFSGLGDPITSGLRSGGTGLHRNSIDAFINAESTAFGSTEIRSPGILAITGVYSGVQVQMLMRGMDQSKGADVLQKPSVITRSGQRAKVEVIDEFIYPTEYEPPELPNSVSSTSSPILGGGGFSSFPVTPATPTAFETRDVGVILEVEPTVGANKKFIELSLSPQLVEFQGFVNYGTPVSSAGADILGNPTTATITENRILMPVFNTVRLKDQTITIQDGATIVLGGVMTSRKNKVEDKVPLLGDIPYAGRLFRSEAEQTFNEAVIVTVQAELIDPTGTPWNNR